VITVRVVPHTVRDGVQVIEVWDGPTFLATIVPSGVDPRTLRVISKHTIRAALTTAPASISNTPGAGEPGEILITIGAW
jgi:hypothetical protein